MIPADYSTLEEMRVERDAAYAASKDPRIAIPIRDEQARAASSLGVVIIRFGALIGPVNTFDDRLEEFITNGKESAE